MDLLAVVKLFWPKLLPMNVKPTLFPSRYNNTFVGTFVCVLDISTSVVGQQVWWDKNSGRETPCLSYALMLAQLQLLSVCNTILLKKFL